MEYLLLGHLCLDESPAGDVPGGTVLYASRAVAALGRRTAVFTAAPEPQRAQEALAGCSVAVQPAAQWTRFRNEYRDGARRQFSASQGPRLDLSQLPDGWLDRSQVVHFAPVAGEVRPQPGLRRPGRIVGLTAQGLMRRFLSDGSVVPCDPGLSASDLEAVDAIVVSQEDVAWNPALPERWAAVVPVVVVTAGASGCRVLAAGTESVVPVEPVMGADPTGAGDLFATVFFLALGASRPAEAAVRLAGRFVGKVLQARAAGREATAIDEAAADCPLVTRYPTTGYNPAGTG